MSECELECLIVLLYNRNVGFFPFFKHPYGLSSVSLIGENVDVDVDNDVDGAGECEGDMDSNDSMIGLANSEGAISSDIGIGSDMNVNMGLGAADMGVDGINSGGSSVYIKLPASVIAVPCARGFPKANVIFSFLGAEE